MIAERGIDSIKASERRKLGLRVLAAIGVIQVAFLACYTIPNLIFGMNVKEWPDDVQQRSYFTDHICGDGTNRACPDPDLPLTRNDNGSPERTSYVTPDGELVVP
jgi:hypothetical protein